MYLPCLVCPYMGSDGRWYTCVRVLAQTGRSPPAQLIVAEPAAADDPGAMAAGDPGAMAPGELCVVVVVVVVVVDELPLFLPPEQAASASAAVTAKRIVNC